METPMLPGGRALGCLRFKSYYVVWKPPMCLYLLRNFMSLNRTMQYGNPGFRLSHTFGKKGLNRTMQYGNVDVPGRSSVRRIGLNRTMQYGNKSSLMISNCLLTFKSYYVVWKLEWVVELFSSGGRFKSYYVVWKPFFFLFVSKEEKSLNRTMQYGNFIIKLIGVVFYIV